MILPEVFTAGLGQLRDCLGLSEEGRSWILKPTSCAWGYHKTGRTACDPARPTSHSPATNTRSNRGFELSPRLRPSKMGGPA